MDDLFLHMEFAGNAVHGSCTYVITSSTHISIVLFLYATINVKNIPLLLVNAIYSSYLICLDIHTFVAISTIDEQGLLFYPIIIWKINLEKDVPAKMPFNLASTVESLEYISNSKTIVSDGIDALNTRIPFIFMP